MDEPKPTIVANPDAPIFYVDEIAGAISAPGGNVRLDFASLVPGYTPNGGVMQYRRECVRIVMSGPGFDAMLEFLARVEDRRREGGSASLAPILPLRRSSGGTEPPR